MASSDTALIIARHEQSPPSAWFHRLDYRFVAGAAMMERLLDRGSYKSKQKPRGDVDAPVREVGVRARSSVACPGLQFRRSRRDRIYLSSQHRCLLGAVLEKSPVSRIVRGVLGASTLYTIPSELLGTGPRRELPFSIVNGPGPSQHSHASAFLASTAQRDGFLLIAAFLITFLFIRTSARLIRKQVSWWPGNVSTKGGLHIHHLVWGICLVLASGFLSIALRPDGFWGGALAVLFGIGTGLTLDEFALWLRLDDVYWAQEGRESLDAVIVAALLGGLVVLGVSPIDSSTHGWAIPLVLAINVLLSIAAILKGRLLLGLLGVFVPLVSLVAVIRLAAPSSPWARWFYRPGSRKLSRSERRFARARARHIRIMNLIGGAPTAVATGTVARADETAKTD
jgi:hypothetical protein